MGQKGQQALAAGGGGEEVTGAGGRLNVAYKLMSRSEVCFSDVRGITVPSRGYM